MPKTVCQSVAWFKRYKTLKSVTVGRSVGRSLNLRKFSYSAKTRSAFGLARNNTYVVYKGPQMHPCVNLWTACLSDKPVPIPAALSHLLRLRHIFPLRRPPPLLTSPTPDDVTGVRTGAGRRRVPAAARRAQGGSGPGGGTARRYDGRRRDGRPCWTSTAPRRYPQLLGRISVGRHGLGVTGRSVFWTGLRSSI